VSVVDRLLEQWDGLVKYMKKLPAVDKFVDKQSRYGIIMRKINKNDILVQLNFISSTGAIFNEFSKTFQTERDPLIHILHESLVEILKRMMRRFIKSEVVDTSVDLVDLDVSESENQLLDVDIEIGNEARTSLQKVSSAEQRKLVLHNIRKFYYATVTYMQKKLPVSNALLKHLGCMRPSIVKRQDGVTSIRYICNALPVTKLSLDRLPNVIDEWKILQADDDLPAEWNDGTLRVDHVWRSIFPLKNAAGGLKYGNLQIVVKACLCLAHGNSDLERGFSTNANAVTEVRSALSVESVNGIRAIKDAMNLEDRGRPKSR
jgi:hypothetical protein